MENFKSTIKRNLDLSGLPLDMIHASIIEVIWFYIKGEENK
jgi:hypothetical protein